MYPGIDLATSVLTLLKQGTMRIKSALTQQLIAQIVCCQIDQRPIDRVRSKASPGACPPFRVSFSSVAPSCAA